MNETIQVVADRSERLDTFLARQFPEYSRSFWQRACESGTVTSSGNSLPSRYKVHVGELLTVPVFHKPSFAGRTLPIIYEDDDVLVINKPSGILTHAKGEQSDEFTVADFVRPRTTDGVATNRPGIVHRLDRDTSGVLIAAKHTEAKHWLQKQFAERNVKKAYIALLHGHLKEPRATLDLPIERNPKKPQTFRVNANGKPAQTVYETMRVFPHHTLVKLRPLTGRTHQLRVHMAYLDHPIVGDPWYGTTDEALGRLFLHAAELEITLPSHERKLFAAPLAPELEQYIETL